MIKFTYADGQDICVFDGEKTVKYSSGYIEKYKRNAENSRRATEWKKTGEGAVFRGDATVDDASEVVIESSIGGIYPCTESDWVVYSFTVNGTSGIYKKCLTDEKTPETHVINSHDFNFYGGMLDASNGKLVVSAQRGYFADIALFDVDSSDFKTLTDGDTLDVDPYISPDERGIIYFSSRGAGRDGKGNFVKFSPASICKLDLNAMTVDEVVASPKYNYFKPVRHGGKLYAIKAPVKEKSGNPFLEIILIPWRILQGIANFINIFVTATTGKGLTEGGPNPARGKDYDSRYVTVAGNMIDVNKQLKKNASKRDTDYGFIPKSWQLVELGSGEVIKSGIGDFDVAEDGTIIATNGKRIFAIKDGKSKKVCNAEFCVKVNCKHGTAAASTYSDPFDL